MMASHSSLPFPSSAISSVGCSLIHGSVRLASDSDLTNDVACNVLVSLRSQFTQPLLNTVTSICLGKWVLALTERNRCLTFRSRLRFQLPSCRYITPCLMRSWVMTWLTRLASQGVQCSFQFHETVNSSTLLQYKFHIYSLFGKRQYNLN